MSLADSVSTMNSKLTGKSKVGGLINVGNKKKIDLKKSSKVNDTILKQ